MSSQQHVCHSGGCSGADYFFGLEALKLDHTVYHYGFNGMRSPCPRKEITYLSQAELCEADQYLMKANDQLLKRSWPTRTDYGNNLLRRNYFQIKDSNRIYAATRLDEDGVVIGGTGWTIAMGILAGISSIYIYDWEKMKYFAWEWPTVPAWWNWYEIPLEHIPLPSGHYTGIGSHDLPVHGIEAIRSLYAKAKVLL